MNVEDLEEYLETLEQYFFSSVSTITAGFPDIHDAVNRLWIDISRYGPQLPSFPDVHLPALGDFQVPPPPPPPPPPRHISWTQSSYDWASKHPWKTFGLVIGATGTGFLLAGYAKAYVRKQRAHARKTRNNDRRQVVVVLGGDTPFALPLIRELENKGYIVIASVSTPEACSLLESKCQGYVRALVLDPSEPATINAFLRSLTSTLSVRFPLNSSGDPFAPTSSQPYIHSVISLLTLASHLSVSPAPLEHVALNDTYIRYLTAAQITPLRVLQCLLPLLRASPRDKGAKTMVVCLPATEARVGIPFASVQSMTVASTLRATEILRREINLAAMTDRSGSMGNIKVIIAEIGSLKCGSTAVIHPFEERSIADLYRSMENWSPSEKMSYGPAFAAVVQGSPMPRSRWQSIRDVFKGGDHFGLPRRPTDISVFVSRVLDVVSDGAIGPYLFGLGFLWRRARITIRGDRFSVGSGAMTYKIASYLPSLILDAILNLPAVLIYIRNRLSPAPPASSTGQPGPRPTTAAQAGRDTSGSDETAPDWEAESNASDAPEHSWIRLQRSQDGGGNPWVP
ncbi:hypothetical protein M378DRAFT_157079 [Amanita muscaria Koide BX008]|uniref:DUF1776-domain-containing protein n=1 Tax=Amanita muscaria (strain Koide BX008) TaxID=946122 RepID=A0A0C2X689_AMAMK|nr:hypothetical protein M378DRAFT_157079 [Amanita muscaria Koide BX008]